MKEIKAASLKMKNNKALGGTGLSTDMLKNLPNDALDFLCKRKGAYQNLINFRGICLKESTAKIMNIIISNCLLKHFHVIGD